MHSRSIVVAQTTYNNINRIAIQQGLLIEFSCNPHIDSLLRALLACVIIRLCVQQLPQQMCLTHVGLEANTLFLRQASVKTIGSGLYFFLFSFSFLFSFLFYFSPFLFLELWGQGQKCSVTSVTSDDVVTILITEPKRRKQKVLFQNNVIQHGHHMLAPCFIHGHLEQGAQQLAWTICKSI